MARGVAIRVNGAPDETATSATAGPFVSASDGHGTSESPNSLAATTWWTGSLCFARTLRGRSIRSHRDFSAGRVEMMNPA